MTPLQRYQSDLEKGIIIADAAQQRAIELLENLYKELTSTNSQRDRGFLARVQKLFALETNQPLQGIYFWGGVGRGKTYLMDIFYDCLPFENRLRTHFHRFMQRVHQDLNRLKGEKDPLRQVAAGIAGQAQVICFDEFFVSDIGDAMILAGLLKELFVRNVLLITTSNIEPELLYENGLQRDRFLPAIRLLEENLLVHELGGDTDYRLRCLSQAELYQWPLSEESDAILMKRFADLAPDFAEAVRNEAVDILGRPINSRYCADDVVWFEFNQICAGPRSVYDYIELATLFHAVLVGNVPQLRVGMDDLARRFIYLVDELYDRGVKLILSAAVPVSELYTGTVLRGEFQRTQSRLLEMQSHEYLARPHRP